MVSVLKALAVTLSRFVDGERYRAEAKKIKENIPSDLLKHTEKYVDKGAPLEWIDETTERVSGLNYGASGVLPYIGARKIAEEL